MSGKFENFGAFNPVPGSNNPGWVCRVTSSSGKKYYVAVAIRAATIPDYSVYEPDHIDWKSYTGGYSPLGQGDIKELAAKFKNVERFDSL